MSDFDIHHCPRCELRFTNLSELEDHLRHDHDVDLSPVTRHLATETTAAAAPTARVVVPLDPTRSTAGDAPHVAAMLGRQGSWAVELVAAAPESMGDGPTTRFLESKAKELSRPDLPVTSTVLPGGDPAGAVVAHVGADPTLLVCLDSRARGAAGELVFGSVAEEIVRHSTVPVLVCGPHIKTAERYERIVVGLDGSELAERALVAAEVLAAGLGVPVELLQVLDPDIAVPADVAETAYLSRVSSAASARIDAFDTVHDRHPDRALAYTAADRPGTILAVGTQGRTGFQRLRMGSVAIGAVRHATCPVLIVPPGLAPAAG